MDEALVSDECYGTFLLRGKARIALYDGLVWIYELHYHIGLSSNMGSSLVAHPTWTWRINVTVLDGKISRVSV